MTYRFPVFKRSLELTTNAATICFISTGPAAFAATDAVIQNTTTFGHVKFINVDAARSNIHCLRALYFKIRISRLKNGFGPYTLHLGINEAFPRSA